MSYSSNNPLLVTSSYIERTYLLRIFWLKIIYKYKYIKLAVNISEAVFISKVLTFMIILLLVLCFFYQMSSINNYYYWCDFAENGQIFFQDPATPIMEGITDLYNEIFVLLLFLSTIIFYVYFRIFDLFNKKLNRAELSIPNAVVTEVIWTIIPMLLLILIAIPSIGLLYAELENPAANLVLNVLGYQWYWNYQHTFDLQVYNPLDPAWQMSQLPKLKTELINMAYGYKPKYEFITKIFDYKHYNLKSALGFVHLSFTDDSYYNNLVLTPSTDPITSGTNSKALWIWSFFQKSLPSLWGINSDDISGLSLFQKAMLLAALDAKKVTDVEFRTNLPYKNYNSYMLADTLLEEGDLRLLKTTNYPRLPTNKHIMIIASSNDVIHSWSVPSLGIKIDALSSRLNSTMTFIKREGLFYGQCSEICGSNHGFMPILVESYNPKIYHLWLHINKSDAE